MIEFIRSVDYSFFPHYSVYPKILLYSNDKHFYSMGTLVLCNSTSVLRNCAILLFWPTNKMNEVTSMAVQFINVESFFSLRKFIGPKNPLLTARIPYFVFLRRSGKKTWRPSLKAARKSWPN